MWDGYISSVSDLSVAVTTKGAVILIDEINSFLHPGASKALVRTLLARYASHQYLVSTHSAELIGLGAASQIFDIKRVGMVSTVTQIKPKQILELTNAARDLGISASDIFNFEVIVWVEGKTEEFCFADVASELQLASERVKFVAVLATGDFDRNNKDRTKTLEIYGRLSSAMSPMLNKPVFAFDKEGLSDDDIMNVRRQTQYNAIFLPRRNIESFVLHPESISAYYSELLPGQPDLADAVKVEAALIAAAGMETIGKSCWNGSLSDPDWLSVADGASIVSRAVSALSLQQVEYRKIPHTGGIIAKRLTLDPAGLEELIDYLKTVIKKAAG